MRPRILVLWHEQGNHLGVCAIREEGGLPLLLICDEEYTGINPFYSYPLSVMDMFGWHIIGEL